MTDLVSTIDDLPQGTLYKTMALDFLSKWPQLSDVQRAKDKTIQLFLLYT
jgi:hypothetical protein